MADDLSLLLKIRGDSAGGKAAVAETRAAISSLRSTSAAEFASIHSIANSTLGKVTQSLTQVASQTPIVGTAVNSLTTNFGSLGTASTTATAGLSAVAGGAVLAAAATGALITGVIALGKAIFDLAKSTSDAGSKIFDLSQKTNFSAETLSALQNEAEQSGGSIESIAASLGIFQSNMVKAAEGNKDLAKTFRDLKVDTTNQEVAFRQAIKALFEMGETERQAAKAKELFGRSAKDLLGVIKATNGDIDAAIKKWEDLGLIIGGQAAASADAFGDALDLLNKQFTGLGRTIGFSVIPVLTVFFGDISEGLTRNRGDWEFWGTEIEKIVASVLGAAQGLASYIKSGFTLDLVTEVSLASRQLFDRAQVDKAVLSAIAVSGAVARGRGAGGGTAGGGAGTRAKRNTELQDAIKEAALAEKEALQIVAGNVAENKRALDEQVRDIKEFTERAKKLADDAHDAAIVRINAEQAAIEQALAKKLITQKEFNQRDRELTLENEQATQKNSDEIFSLEQDRDKKIAAAELAARERAVQIAEDADNRTIERIQARGERELIAKSEIERQIATVIDEGFARRRKALEDEDTAYQTSLERHQAIADELIRLDGERAGAAEEAARRILKAQFDEQNEGARGATRKRRTTDPDSIDESAVPTSAVDQLFKAVNDNLTGTAQTTALAGLEALTGAFQGLGQAVGQVVQAWVLYGSAGQSVRQVTAQILAGVAQQAAIKAIFELAEGFAALALAFFGIPNAGPSASAHFAAAAIYGSIAGVAAIAGRAVAGNAFQSASGGGTSGGGRGGSGGSTSGGSNSAPSSQDTNRLNYQPTIQVHLHGEAAAAFKYKVIDVIVDDHRDNGRVRTMVETGQV